MPVLTRSELLITGWGSLVFLLACGLCQSSPPSPAPDEWGEGFLPSVFRLAASLQQVAPAGSASSCGPVPALCPPGPGDGKGGPGNRAKHVSTDTATPSHASLITPSSHFGLLPAGTLVGTWLRFRVPCGISAPDLSLCSLRQKGWTDSRSRGDSGLASAPEPYPSSLASCLCQHYPLREHPSQHLCCSTPCPYGDTMPPNLSGPHSLL